MPLNTEVDYNNVIIKGTVELGVKGERGLQGFKGDQGERGLQGFKGDQGIQGIQGPPGMPVAHELGDDPALAVSQKLLTDSIADKVDKVLGYSLVDDDEIDKLSTVEQDAQKNTVSSVAGRQGDVLLDKEDVGLGAVDNTSDADKPVSTAVAAALADIDALVDKNVEDIGDLSQLPFHDKSSLVGAIREFLNIVGEAFGSVVELIVPIDDAAGLGVTNATWSADKSSRELGELSALIGDVESVLVAINGEP